MVFHPGHHARNLVLLQSHSSPSPSKEMAPGKENLVLKLCKNHFFNRAHFSYFLKFPLSASHHLREELFGVWRALVGMWAASEWPPLGGQRSPQPPSNGPQELGGPRGSLENRTSPSAFFRALAREGEGPPQQSSPDSLRLSSPLPSGCTALETFRTQLRALQLLVGRQSASRGAASPSSPRLTSPLPPKDAAVVPCPQSLNVTAPSSS